MKIGVCAWGSLIWDPRNLMTRGGFQPIGPRIPLEFSRISGRGEQRRLTLAIDERDGALCQTFVAQSAFSEISDAIDNLAEREGLYYKEDVGWSIAASGKASARAMSRHPYVLRYIQSFLDGAGFDALIWTALPPNFAARLSDGASFSVSRALQVLLDDFSEREFGASMEYMRRVPTEIVTPLRSAAEEIFASRALRW